MFETDRLPNLESICEAGMSGPLESQVPPWTASAWPSLYTGTNPGKHGVYGFLCFDGYDWDIVDASHIRERTLWEYLTEHGHTSVVVNAPVTHPPREFDGALVPGYTAPENPECHPPGLLDEVESAIGPYQVYAEEEGNTTDDPEAVAADLSNLVTLRGETFRYLTDRFEPEFGFIQFQATDTICHQVPESDAVDEVFQSVDDEIGTILDVCDPDVVIVASDHGIGPYERRVAINEVLRDAGLLTATSEGDGMPNWSRVRDRSLRNGNEDSGLIDRTLVSGARVASRLGLSTKHVGPLLQRFNLNERIVQYAPDSLLRASTEQVDFSNSKAYARSRIECGIRINLAGREPAGIVPSDKYETIRERVIEILSALETPEGKPVFETVARREAFFQGAATDHAVDVVTIPRDYENYVTTWLTGSVFTPAGEPAWDHRPYGFLAVAGDGIDADSTLAGAHLFDVAPTLLATMDIPVAERMDGRVLSPVQSVGEKAYSDYVAGERTVNEDETVRNRLADLGYLE